MAPRRSVSKPRDREPISLKARLHAGLNARQAGSTAVAERIFRDVLQDHPGQPDALNLLGVMLAERGRAEEAAILLRQAASARPASRVIPVNLAQALLAANRPGDAAEILTTLNESDVVTRLLLVRALLADRRPDEAEACARRALVDAPCDPALLTALGDALVQSERAAEALPHYERAIAAAPNHGPAHNNLGTALEKLGRPAEAARAFGRALECMPGHSGAHINLGSVLLRLGDAVGAEQAFARVLEREPYNQRAIAYLAIARQESAVLSPETARAAFEPLIHEELPGCPDSFSTLTEFHAALICELYAHPNRRRDVSGTATTGGFDALHLFEYDAPALRALEGLLRVAVERHIARLRPAEGHPFLGRRPRDWILDVWATFLESGGYQYPHIHPSGWISGVYYVQVPPSVSGARGGNEGWIEFNRPDESFGYTFRPDVFCRKPAPGLLLLFPSYIYHRTLPFQGERDRVSIAFDVKAVA